MVKQLLKLNLPIGIVRVILSFLSERYSYVAVNGSFSFFKSVDIGCVQGSVLGPYLCNIYTNSLAKIVKSEDSEAFVMVSCLL